MVLCAKPRVARTRYKCNPTIRRWGLEILEALCDGDAEKLQMVVQTKGAIIDSQVICHARGAAMDYAGVGFYDSTCGDWADPLIGKALDGDTALIIALRQCDPSLAAVLIKNHASLYIKNSIDESPIQMVWNSCLTLRKVALDPNATMSADEKAIVEKREEYEGLHKFLDCELQSYHSKMYNDAREEITLIYEEHHPDRLSKLDAQMQQFYGRESELLALIREKYAD